MDLNKLFQMQRVLRDHIGYNQPDRFNKLILALLVELGECANEWRGFKFWSKDQQPRLKKARGPYVDLEDAKFYNPLLEEYVDGLHFVLEIGIELNDPDELAYLVPISSMRGSVLEQFRACFYYASHVTSCYEKLLHHYIGLGELLGFTWEAIEHAYKEKNAINHKRQEAGY